LLLKQNQKLKKCLRRYFGINERNTEKDLEAKYKAQSEEKETTRSRNQTLQTRCFNFQSQAQANGQMGSEKRAELQKDNS
jgi:hypothetical protein